jgi:hypothetical protein
MVPLALLLAGPQSQFPAAVMLHRARPAAEAGVKADGELADPDPEAPQRAWHRDHSGAYAARHQQVEQD